MSSIFILLIAPSDALYANSSRMHLGDIFRGLESLIGTAATKFLFALPFAALSYLFIRKAHEAQVESTGKKTK